MDALDAWRFCDEVSAIQAALLILGLDPSAHEGVANWSARDRPPGFDGLFTALTNDIMAGRLTATIRRSAWQRGWDEEPEQGVEVAEHVTSFPGEEARWYPKGSIFYRTAPDWDLTRVHMTDLRQWVEGRQRQGRSIAGDSFFAPEPAASAGYLDPTHPRYTFKLAASVAAWLALEDAEVRTSPKQALEKWLRANAAQFGMVDPSTGRAVEQAIQECAKVANWQPGGGAPKTPVVSGK